MHSDNRHSGLRWEHQGSERNSASNGESGLRESSPRRHSDGDRERGQRTGGEWREGPYGGSEDERSTPERIGESPAHAGPAPSGQHSFRGERARSSDQGFGGYGSGYGGPEPRHHGDYDQGHDTRYRTVRRYRGRPPKGYERSDDRTREMICERLMEEPSIDAGDVSITVTGGQVTLEGTVHNRRMKYDIEEVVEECGAKDMQNNLRIGPGPSSHGLDSSQGSNISSSSGTSSEPEGTKKP